MSAASVQITGLFAYPIKSCRAVALNETQLTLRGIAHDREFLVVDETDAFLTQRNTPGLATVQIALEESGLVLTAPTGAELRLPFSAADDREARAVRKVTIFSDQLLADDAGDEAAEWFSGVLGRSARLVRIGASSSRKVPLKRIPETLRPDSGPEISFTDAFPTLLVSEESVADLNTRLPQAIPMSRFRPNIVVRGCAPYDENRWNVIRSGDLTFGCATTCLRCVITSIDQQTGVSQGVEPLRTLATYRRAPDGNGVMFGQYLIHSGAGSLRVGDALRIER